MSLCMISFLRGSERSQQVNLEPESSLELRRGLEDTRKLTLNLLVPMILGIPSITGSKALGPLTLALLIYTTSLHLVMSTSCLQEFPKLSAFLHVVPFLSITCMAAVELFIVANSPALATVGLLVGLSPSLIMAVAVYHGKWCTDQEAASMRLPVRLREVSTLTSS